MARPAVLEFHDPEVARLFHEEERAYHIVYFAHIPQTIEAVALRAQVSISTMRRLVKRFLELGLLIQVGVQERSHLYQLAAERIIVHDEQAPLDTLEDFRKTLGGRWERFMQAAIHDYNRQQEADPWVLVIQGKSDGWGEAVAIPTSQVQGHPPRLPTLHNIWLTPHLTAENAKLIAAEIENLRVRISELHDPEKGKAVYNIHLGFAREPV